MFDPLTRTALGLILELSMNKGEADDGPWHSVDELFGPRTDAAFALSSVLHPDERSQTPTARFLFFKKNPGAMAKLRRFR